MELVAMLSVELEHADAPWADPGTPGGPTP
jgi:hypothetical protein